MGSAAIKSKNGYDALHVAAKHANIDILKILTEALPELLLTTDLSNMTALHTAASQGRTEVVNFLLERNSNLATIVRNNGKTSLHSAARNGHLEVVEALMSKEPGTAMRIDKKGQTALHMAVKGQSIELVDMMIKPDLSLINVVDSKGEHCITYSSKKRSSSAPRPNAPNHPSWPEVACAISHFHSRNNAGQQNLGLISSYQPFTSRVKIMPDRKKTSYYSTTSQPLAFGSISSICNTSHSISDTSCYAARRNLGQNQLVADKASNIVSESEVFFPFYREATCSRQDRQQKVLLDPNQIPQSPRWILMHTGRLGTNINLFLDFFARSLLELPWQIMALPMELKVLVLLETLVVDFAHEMDRRHQCLWQCYNLGIWTCNDDEMQ
ncbi:hypothetical protein Nepgr_020683 [Nepenthes gracilis]|uniref:Uncharacterized protein n=1 Tax=Nepenthes gracilis TaxID=150966 RepID=A0AAD3SYG0_NEPGR|nr:hypothetical protein Nepgr_020683 [Nepenthes gracilis]